MELSIFLAKVIGLGLVLISLSLLLNKKNVDLLFDLYMHAAAVYLTGIFETFLGLAFVFSHNVWTPDFRVIITLIGWILLLRGVGRSLFPTRIPIILEKFRHLRSIITPLSVFILLIGVYLAYSGFSR